MEYLGLDLHGIAELVDVRGRKVFSRYPQHVNEAIGHTTAYQLNCTEIRLVPLSDCFYNIRIHGTPPYVQSHGLLWGLCLSGGVSVY
jgi:hypothetical protein